MTDAQKKERACERCEWFRFASQFSIFGICHATPALYMRHRTAWCAQFKERG